MGLAPDLVRSGFLLAGAVLLVCIFGLPSCRLPFIFLRCTGGVTALLVVSLSGLGVERLPDCSALASALDSRRVPLSLLVAPQCLLSSPRLTSWVLGRVAGGDAPVLLGVERHRAGLWPAVLPAQETRLRLLAARAALAQLDLPVLGYAPGGRAVPSATLLRDNGFIFSAELRGVRDLGSGDLLAGRVLGRAPWHWERAEPWWCRALVLGAARAARSGRLVRVSVPAAFVGRPGIAQAVLDAVDIAMHHGARPTTYAALWPRRARVTPRSALRAAAR